MSSPIKVTVHEITLEHGDDPIAAILTAIREIGGAAEQGPQPEPEPVKPSDKNRETGMEQRVEGAVSKPKEEGATTPYDPLRSLADRLQKHQDDGKEQGYLVSAEYNEAIAALRIAADKIEALRRFNERICKANATLHEAKRRLQQEGRDLAGRNQTLNAEAHQYRVEIAALQERLTVEAACTAQLGRRLNSIVRAVRSNA